MGGISIFFLVFAMGIGIDLSRLYAAKHKAQSLADIASMASAIQVQDSGIPIGQGADGFADGIMYSTEEIGYVSQSYNDFNFMVNYDALDQEVKATVFADIDTFMLSLFGINSLSTEAYSETRFNYYEKLRPASILFILDVSGSMWFNDLPNGRITNRSVLRSATSSTLSSA